MQLEIQARFGDVDDDSFVFIETITRDSESTPEFLLAGQWVSVEFQEEGATMRVEGDELDVAPDGTWHEGKLLGILVRGRLRRALDVYREGPMHCTGPKY